MTTGAENVNGAREFVERVGREAVLDRLERLQTRIDGLADELAANQREYEELQRTYRISLAEHDSLTTKLRSLDAEEPAC